MAPSASPLLPQSACAERGAPKGVMRAEAPRGGGGAAAAPPRPGLPVAGIVPWAVALGCCVLCSCTDAGAFYAKVVSDGYLTTAETDPMLAGENAVLSWATVLVCILLPCVGPRVVAAAGAGISILGYNALRCLGKPTLPQHLLSARCMTSVGGQCVFLASISFSNLIPHRQGCLDGLMEGALNSSGLLFLPLINSSAITLSVYCSIACWFMVTVLVFLLCFYPDVPYERGEQFATLSWPSLRALRRKPSCLPAWVTCCHALQDARLLLFILCFSWTTLIATWIGSVIQDIDSDAGGSFMAWGYSIVMNSTILVCPFIGALIDSTGFALPGILQILSSQMALLCLLWHVRAAEWSTLFLVNIITATAYTGQFAYLQRHYAAEALPAMLMVTHLSQGVFGLVAYPGLTEVFPHRYKLAVLVLLSPTLLLYAWPLLERRWQGQPRSGEALAGPTAAERAALATALVASDATSLGSALQHTAYGA